MRDRDLPLALLPEAWALLLVLGVGPLRTTDIAPLTEPYRAIKYMAWGFYRHDAWRTSVPPAPTTRMPGRRLGSSPSSSQS